MKQNRIFAPRLALILALVFALLLTGCDSGQRGGGIDAAADPSPTESDAADSESESGRSSSVRWWGSPDKAKPESEAPAEPQAQPAAAAEHGDFLWAVQSGESTVYLMGTMHVLRDDYELSPEVLELFYAADALAVESNVRDPEVMAGATQYLFYDDGSTVYDHLSEQGQAHLREISELYGYDPVLFEMLGFNAFSVSSLFTIAAAEMAGFNTDGVDTKLLDLALASRMEILELEYYADLYIKMETLDDMVMEQICVLTITEPAQMIEELEEMYECYLSGDDERMYDYLWNDVDVDDEFVEMAELYNYYMITERNEIMADSVVSYLEQPGTYFVAAGLAHFLGEGSIVDLLEARGYTVERM